MINRMLTSLILAIAISGCSVSRKDIDNGPPFVSHGNSIERSFAQTGYIVGCVVGIPVSIIALPVTVPLASGSEDAQGGLIVLAPIFGFGYGMGTIVGGIGWPLFGWYELGPINDDISAQRVDSAAASTIAVPPSEPSGSPR